jgi:PKD repeat protein
MFSMVSGRILQTGFIVAVCLLLFQVKNSYSQNYPKQVWPKQNYYTGDTTMTFQWGSFTGAASYQLQYSTDSTFSTFINQSGLTGLFFTAGNLVVGNVYFWRIKANNSSWSPARKFKIFRPTLITGCNSWLSADYGVSVSGSAVTQWNDRSSLQNHFGQSVAAQRPVFAPAAINNKPALTFNGTSSNLIKLADSIRIATFFSVCKFDFPSTDVENYIIGNTYSPPNFSLFGYDDDLLGLRILSNAGGYFGGQKRPDVGNKFGIFGFKIQNSGSAAAFINEANQPGVVSVPGGNFLYNRIGSFLPTNARVMGGQIAELISYSQPLNDVQQEEVNQYLRFKYSNPANLGRDTALSSLCVSYPLNAGTGYDEYLWSTGATSQSIVATQIGSYWVRVKDIFGYFSTDTIKISSSFNFNQPQNQILCLGSSFVWNPNVPNSGFSLLWSNNTTGPTLTITQAGTYTVQVTEIANGCSFTSAPLVVAVDSFPLSGLGAATQNLCTGNQIQLNQLGSPATNIIWNGTLSQPTYTVGSVSQQVWVYATNANSCIAQDTIQVNVVGLAPTINFSMSSKCQSDNIIFTPSSSSPINTYFWDFGDMGTAIGQTPTHAYAQGGNYLIKLSVAAANGCNQTFNKPVFISWRPSVQFATADTCALDSVKFFSQSAANSGVITSTEWNFGDFSPTAFGSNVVHVYNTPAVYTVTLTVSNDSGCTAVLSKPVNVKQSAFADFNFEGVCYGQPVKFFNTTTATLPILVTAYQWKINGTTNANFNTQYTFPGPGVYTVSLRATTNNNCRAYAVKQIPVLHAVNANFSVNDTICTGRLLSLADSSTADNDTISSWKWRFSNEAVINQPLPQFAFNSSGNKTIRLIVSSQQGCVDSVQKTIFVKLSPVSSFLINPAGGAAPLTVSFLNESTSAQSYIWEFGNGQGSVVQNPPQQIYSDTGIYNVSLIAINNNGCRDTSYRQVFVNPDFRALQISAVNCKVKDGFVSFDANIFNGGTFPITQVLLSARVNYDATMQQEFNVLIPPGQELNLPFTAALKYLSNPEFCCVKVDAFNVSMEVPAPDDILCKAIQNQFWLADPFPNPVDELLTLQFILPYNDVLEFYLSSAEGKDFGLIQRGNYLKGLNTFTFNAQNLSKGLYILRLRFADKFHPVKFFKN